MTTMRGQLGLGPLLPRQTARRRAGAKASAAGRASAGGEEEMPRARGFGTALSPVACARTSATSRAHPVSRPGANPSASSRTAALRYAAWNWPITPAADRAASTDLEQVFATWSRTPEAPILAECGVTFDVIEADAADGRTALMRLDRLGVQLGPILATPIHGAAAATARLSFLVRVGTAAALSPLIDPDTGPTLLGRGDHVELPRALDQPQPQQHRAAAPVEPFWLRAPNLARPMLPTAHVVLGALALAPHRSLPGR